MALNAVRALHKDHVEYTGVRGADVNPDAGPDEVCGCGEPITWWDSRWMHVFNEDLRIGGEHYPSPARGDYTPGVSEPPHEDEDEDDEERFYPDEVPTVHSRRGITPRLSTDGASRPRQYFYTTTPTYYSGRPYDDDNIVAPPPVSYEEITRTLANLTVSMDAQQLPDPSLPVFTMNDGEYFEVVNPAEQESDTNAQHQEQRQPGPHGGDRADDRRRRR